MIEAAVFALILFAITAIVVGAMITRSIERTRERHLLHQERMVALEKSELSTEEVSQLFVPKAPRTSSPISWIRLFAVGLGLILTFGGVAMLGGLMLFQDPEVKQFWGLGLVPLLIGFGLLLFALIIGHSAFRLAANRSDSTELPQESGTP